MPPELMAILAIAGKAHDELSKNGSGFINQYLSRRAEERAYNREKQFFKWDAVLQNYFANRSEGLQREAWARDDTAYQRTVQDMQKAGINPLLINGLSSSSAVSFSGGSSASAPQGQGSNFQGSDVSSLLSSIAQYQLDKEALDEQKNVNRGNDESRIKADAIASNQDKRAQDLHKEEMKQQAVQTAILNAQKKKAQIDAENAQYELTHKQKFGYADSSPEKIKLVKETAGNVVSGAEKILPKDNRTEIKTQNDSSKSQGEKNLDDFATWLSHVDKVAYDTYMSPYVSQGEKEQIVQQYRNKYMNASKNFKREKRSRK